MYACVTRVCVFYSMCFIYIYHRKTILLEEYCNGTKNYFLDYFV